jgi:hypothetical protein
MKSKLIVVGMAAAVLCSLSVAAFASPQINGGLKLNVNLYTPNGSTDYTKFNSVTIQANGGTLIGLLGTPISNVDLTAANPTFNQAFKVLSSGTSTPTGALSFTYSATVGSETVAPAAPYTVQVNSSGQIVGAPAQYVTSADGKAMCEFYVYAATSPTANDATAYINCID